MSAVTDDVHCIDSGLLIKVLTFEEPHNQLEAATELLAHAFTDGRVVMPSFAWAEIGSVLRKKVRQSVIGAEHAVDIWERVSRMPIEFIETPTLRTRAWEIAARYNLATLYDAAYLACTEVAPAGADSIREFWTTDETLVRSLGAEVPAYVRLIEP
jgi:predicted nucleic acid-binding protein